MPPRPRRNDRRLQSPLKNAARPRTVGPGAYCCIWEASLVQLQHGHEGLGGQLHGSKGTHLLFARPTKSLDFAGNPSRDLTCSGGVNPPCAKALPAANPLYGAAAPPRCAGPQRAKTRCSGPHSSSFSTAIKASVGSCTVPRVRIFFLPSFCFSSSFFFRLMSPP